MAGRADRGGTRRAGRGGAARPVARRAATLNRAAIPRGPAILRGAATLSGGRKITDGPYREAKEVVGGFVVIEADDFETAVAIAEEWPHLPGAGGDVEVRRISD
ncbi:YciI family protein [Planosporangium sp. 12N6]|uniref:YciI family protein n=1 Tax=Planosporangium spinosum TaxID=3402278 RepID=UPI003CE8E928